MDFENFKEQFTEDVGNALSERGIRYTCIIDGKESHLYYEDNNMWFVEGR